ncbi:hypothetical protein GF337_16050, partial [candidate division KSB1 bacterium]|nr:hypothetical protein [candidate division KSB1 bacterium]
MKRWSYILNALLIIVLIMPLSVHAEESIEVDYCNFFLQDRARTSVEIYLSFANSDLKFLKTDSNYIAQAEITMILYDEEGNFVQELSS